MTQSQWHWIGYVVITTSLMVCALEYDFRRMNGNLSRTRGRLIPLPAILCLASFVIYLLGPRTNPYFSWSLSGAVLFLGLLTMILLPVLIAVPAMTFLSYIPPCWGAYFLWVMLVFGPFLNMYGAPFED